MATWRWYVYIVECRDGTYYTGCTWDLPHRIAQHATGGGSRYTARHGFRQLAYAEEHEDLGVARQRERQIKNWRQTKKRKLIEGTWRQEW